MPLHLEEVDGRQMWALICDQCTVKGEHLATIDEVQEGSWHVSGGNPLAELGAFDVLCDICFHLDFDEDAPILHYETRDAIIERLQSMPGGQTLDFHPESTLLAVVNALAMGGSQNYLEARLRATELLDPLSGEASQQGVQEALQRVIHAGDREGFLSYDHVSPTQQRSLTTQQPTRIIERGEVGTTTVFLSLDSCPLPEWVSPGAWVRQSSDGVEGQVHLIDATHVVILLEGDLVYWRRAKNAQFDQDFDRLPEPQKHYERISERGYLGLQVPSDW